MFESNNRVTLICKSDYEKLSRLASNVKTTNRLAAGYLRKLDTAKILDDDFYPKNMVRLGSTVALKDLGTGSLARLTLTGTERDCSTSSTAVTPVSVRSSLGTALLGMRKGEDIMWTLPNGQVRLLRISELLHPDTSGHDSRNCTV